MSFRISLTLLVVLSALLVVAAPAIERFGPSGGAAADPATLPKLAVLHDDSPTSSFAAHITLPRAPDGHFYADVEVDGSATRMLVDTGASVIALTGNDALAMGMTWDDDAVVPVAQGANGPVYGVNVMLDRVELGDFVVERVPAVIIPEGLAVSLLGQSFLSAVQRVEIEGNAMALSRM